MKEKRRKRRRRRRRRKNARTSLYLTSLQRLASQTTKVKGGGA